MADVLIARAPKGTLPIHTVTRATLSGWKKKASKRQADWVEASGFSGAAGKFVLIPGDKGTPEYVLAGVSTEVRSVGLCGALRHAAERGLSVHRRSRRRTRHPPGARLGAR